MSTLRCPNRWIAVAAAVCAYLVMGSAAEDGRFKKLSVYLERNVQDRDVEVRFEATGTDDGLAALQVSAPGERKVIDLRAPDSKLGIRSLTVESPEPADDAVVRADFPEGVYRFAGTTTYGAILRGVALLSHEFPKPAAFEYPRPDQKDVAATALTLRWSVPQGIESCVIFIEQAGSPYEIRAHLPGSASAFTVPRGSCAPARPTNSRSGTVSKEGNRSFIEAAFTTARAR